MGTCFWNSPSKLRMLPGFETSSIGESPDTVTVSWRFPIRITTSTAKVLPARNTMPSRCWVEKPVSSAESTYVPGGRFTRR